MKGFLINKKKAKTVLAVSFNYSQTQKTFSFEVQNVL